MRHRSTQSVDLGDIGPMSPSSQQACRPPAASNHNSSGVAGKRMEQPVSLGNASQEVKTREHCGPAMPTPGPSPECHLAPSIISTDSSILAPAQTPSTEQDLYLDIRIIMQEQMGPEGVEVSDCFLHASDHPPMTPESLTELDLSRIINNPKLRHDVNFDRELHFRPNFDGSKGKQKARAAEEYWKALQGELTVYGVVQHRRMASGEAHTDDYWMRILRCSQQRLPKLLYAVRDILKTLVPEYDQKVIKERLDVDLIMQEIQNGVCDLLDLGNWLARVLQKHCAPMRDELIETMRRDIQIGAQEQKPEKLVSGLRQLFNILEAMKLDVANHQIRHMRPLLIEDTVNFQRRHNAHRIATHKIDVASSRLWLEYEISLLSSEVAVPTHLQALTSALLRSILFEGTAAMYPPTFYRDVDRLRALRIDLHSAICREICREILIEMAGPEAPANEVRKVINALNGTMAPIVGSSARFSDRLENLAAEIMRLVLMIEDRNPRFDSTLLDFIEQRLENDLDTTSMAFERHAQYLYDRLIPKLLESVGYSVKLSALQLQDKLVPHAPVQLSSFGFGAVCGPGASQQPVDPDDYIIRRFTHVLALHWHVWAQLVYLAPPSEHDVRTSLRSSNAKSASTTSAVTVPVAQAVYAPGHRWLPIGVTVTEVPSGLPSPDASPEPSDEASEVQSRPANSSTGHKRADTTSSQHEQAGLDDEWRQPA